MIILIRMNRVKKMKEQGRGGFFCSSMVSICSILSKKPLCKLFGGAGCWIWCWQLQRIYCISNLCQLQQTKKYVSMLNSPSFSILKKCFSTSQNVINPLRLLYLSVHLPLFSIHMHIFSHDRHTVVLHITQSSSSVFVDNPKRCFFFAFFFFFFFFLRELCSFLLRENKKERGIPEIPLSLALCLKYY